MSAESPDARIDALTDALQTALQEQATFRSTMTVALGRLGEREIDVRARLTAIEGRLADGGTVGSSPAPSPAPAADPAPAAAPEPTVAAAVAPAVVVDDERLERLERRQLQIDADLQELGDNLRRFDEQAARMVEHVVHLTQQLSARMDEIAATVARPATEDRTRPAPTAPSATPSTDGIQLPKVVLGSMISSRDRAPGRPAD